MDKVVEESDLDFAHFHCCGDEDLYPFGCPACGHLMVFCYECYTLYDNLTDLAHQGALVNHSDTTAPIFHCPSCGRPFEYFFMRDGCYKVPMAQWVGAGFGHLLNKASRGETDAAQDPAT
jgi:hypothetical protein